MVLQAFFDVNTAQVLTRLKLSTVPLKSTLMSHFREEGGDLYGAPHEVNALGAATAVQRGLFD